jgi:dGTP triphosphohydrolase
MKNTDHINLDGLTVNEHLLDVIKNIKNIKQGSLLESNYLQVKHVISNEILNHTQFDPIEISKREIIQSLANDLLEKYKNSFNEKEVPFGKEFSLSMLVMSTHELNHIIEYCIRQMPESAIQEIKKK